MHLASLRWIVGVSNDIRRDKDPQGGGGNVSARLLGSEWRMYGL